MKISVLDKNKVSVVSARKHSHLPPRDIRTNDTGAKSTGSGNGLASIKKNADTIPLHTGSSTDHINIIPPSFRQNTHNFFQHIPVPPFLEKEDYPVAGISITLMVMHLIDRHGGMAVSDNG